MGGLQVDEGGNLANWSMPGKPVLGVGGAMDLATGARRLIITMTHTDRHGRPKIVPECTLPLTAEGAVDLVITDLAVFTVTPDGLVLTELMPGATLDDVRSRTTATFTAADTVEAGR
jgi:3-oxoacid CoA-transferase